MPKKKTKNPNIIIAIVTGTDYDFQDAVTDIYLSDKETYQRLPSLNIGEDVKTPAKGTEVILWMATNYKCKYFAYGDELVLPDYRKKAVLDAATQKHFDDYRKALKKQLELKKNLADIQKKIAVIDSINISGMQHDEANAKQTLTDYLNRNAAFLKSQIVSKIKV
ncbi:MAG: hypothetical protein LBJ73_05425 [Rickettsiales bacterium]|jgi:hypothetical protein|nr:hypothetical protein [Rickettsiales bacterium]